MSKPKYCFLSSLQIETIRDAIPQLIPKHEPWHFGYIIASRLEDRIKLEFRPTITIGVSRNSFTPIFYGTIFEHSSRTKITGSFKVSLGVRIVMRAISSIALLFAASIFMGVLSNDAIIAEL